MNQRKNNMPLARPENMPNEESREDDISVSIESLVLAASNAELMPQPERDILLEALRKNRLTLEKSLKVFRGNSQISW